MKSSLDVAQRGGGAGGKGGPKAKVGDTREMGGVTLVAVAKDGQIAWEPVGGMDSQASRDAQRRAAQDEARSLRDTASAIKDQRVAEAREPREARLLDGGRARGEGEGVFVF